MSLMRAPVVNDRASRDHKLLAWVPGRAGLVARAFHSLNVYHRRVGAWSVQTPAARRLDAGHYRARVRQPLGKLGRKTLFLRDRRVDEEPLEVICQVRVGR